MALQDVLDEGGHLLLDVGYDLLFYFLEVVRSELSPVRAVLVVGWRRGLVDARLLAHCGRRLLLFGLHFGDFARCNAPSDCPQVRFLTEASAIEQVFVLAFLRLGVDHRLTPLLELDRLGFIIDALVALRHDLSAQMRLLLLFAFAHD